MTVVPAVEMCAHIRRELRARGKKEEDLGTGIDLDVRVQQQPTDLLAEPCRAGLAHDDGRLAGVAERVREPCSLCRLADALGAFEDDQSGRGIGGVTGAVIRA